MIALASGFAQTPETLRAVEASLIGDTGGAGVLWCGRGATALYWAYRIAAVARGGAAVGPLEVILPATCCEAVASAALLAGLSPRFADVARASGLLTLASVQARRTPGTRAVVFTHLYGQTTDLAELARWCQAENILLIEDAAHALGGHFPDGAPVGSAGDMTILSFNRTKIIESGGGALLVRRAPLLEALQMETQTSLSALQPDARRVELLEQSVRHLEHGLVGLFRAGEGTSARGLFARLSGSLADLFVRPMPECAPLAAAWPAIRQIAQRRWEKASRYAEIISDGPWRLLSSWQNSGVCWRFSLLVAFPERLLPFTEEIRGHGALASNLYWPLNDFFRPEDDCPEAKTFARGILNLCVDDTVDLNWVTERAAQILECGQRYRA